MAELREAHLEKVTLLLLDPLHVYCGHWVQVVRLAVIVKVSASLVVVQLHGFLAKGARGYCLCLLKKAIDFCFNNCYFRY